MDEQMEMPAAEENTAPAEKPAGFIANIYDFADIISTAILIIAFIFLFLFRFAGVDGPSMLPTLHQDDWLAISAYLKTPKQGDVVITTQPNYFNEPIVKRVIAVGGQTINIDDATGDVYVDGELLEEPYLDASVRTYTSDSTIRFPLSVPEGKVFVMGDNRPHSTDSRSSMVGLIDEDYILGKVMFRVFPLGNFKVK